MSTLHRRLAVLVLSLACAGAASATAIYSSATKSTFTLLGLAPTSLAPVTDIKENLPASPTMTIGTATATIDYALLSGADAHPLSIDSKVSGSASAPPTSSSSAAALRGHLIEIDRGTPDDPLPRVTLDFMFEIAWEVHLAVDMPTLESAAGGAYFAIAGFEDGIDSISISPGMPGEVVIGADGKWRWEFNPSYFTTMADVDVTAGLVVTGSITVEAGTVGAFSVITDAAGRADARPLPAPGSLLLVGMLLALMPLLPAGRTRIRARAR